MSQEETLAVRRGEVAPTAFPHLNLWDMLALAEGQILLARVKSLNIKGPMCPPKEKLPHRISGGKISGSRPCESCLREEGNPPPRPGTWRTRSSSTAASSRPARRAPVRAVRPASALCSLPPAWGRGRGRGTRLSGFRDCLMRVVAASGCRLFFESGVKQYPGHSVIGFPCLIKTNPQ